MKRTNIFLGIFSLCLIIGGAAALWRSTELYPLYPHWIVVGLFLITFGLVIDAVIWRSEKKYQQQKDVIGVARAHDKITVDRVSELTNTPVSKVTKILYEAAADGKIKGTVKGDTFVRTEETAPGTLEKVTVEREVMVSRKVPENCFNCGAAIDPQGVEWVGPDSVRCPHCGSTLAVTTERV
jgi:hypothetical protein